MRAGGVRACVGLGGRLAAGGEAWSWRAVCRGLGPGGGRGGLQAVAARPAALGCVSAWVRAAGLAGGGALRAGGSGWRGAGPACGLLGAWRGSDRRCGACSLFGLGACLALR